MTITDLMNQVDSRQDELIEILTTLIRYETPAPPARNTKEAQNYVAKFLAQHNFNIDTWELYPNDPIVVGTKKGTHSQTHQSLIINGHMDVAEIQADEKWLTSPFEPVVTKDSVIGRGAADMKGGLAGSLFAIQLLQEAGIELKGDLIFESVIGEEVGEAGTLQCCEKGYSADFAVIVDTSDLHIQGQGGVITGWITIKNPNTFHDATRRNMIHAGGGLNEASSIEKMMKLITALQELERHWAITKTYEGYPPGTNTINPAVIEGGRHAAFVADECRLWITVHYYPNETHEEVIKEIEAHLLQTAKADIWLRDHLPTFKWGGTSMIEDRGEIFPSLEVDPNHPAVKTLQKSHEISTKEKAILDVSPTVTDGGWFGDANIPAAIYGPGDLANAHSVNEEVKISQLITFTKTMISFIYEWTNQEK